MKLIILLLLILLTSCSTKTNNRLDYIRFYDFSSNFYEFQIDFLSTEKIKEGLDNIKYSITGYGQATTTLYDSRCTSYLLFDEYDLNYNYISNKKIDNFQLTTVDSITYLNQNNYIYNKYNIPIALSLPTFITDPKDTYRIYDAIDKNVFNIKYNESNTKLTLSYDLKTNNPTIDDIAIFEPCFSLAVFHRKYDYTCYYSLQLEINKDIITQEVLTIKLLDKNNSIVKSLFVKINKIDMKKIVPHDLNYIEKTSDITITRDYISENLIFGEFPQE